MSRMSLSTDYTDLILYFCPSVPYIFIHRLHRFFLFVCPVCLNLQVCPVCLKNYKPVPYV